MKPLYLTAALLCTAALFWFAFSSAGPESHAEQKAAGTVSSAKPQGLAPAPQGVQAEAAAASSQTGGTANTASQDSRPPAEGSLPPPPADAPKEAVLDFIQGTATTYDARELPKIRPYLTHPDPEMRAAALDGMITLGDPAAAPLLREAAKESKDPKETAALLQAADYLELPPISLAPTLKKKKARAPAKP